MKKSLLFSWTAMFVAYSIAIISAYLIFEAFKLQYSTIIALLIADLAATIIIFIASMVLNNSSMYDPYWSVIPPLMVYLFIAEEGAGGNEIRQTLVLILVSFWAIRLTTNFLRDWPGLIHEDWRYVDFRNNNPKTYWLISFSGIHFFPTLIVFLACLPAFMACKSDASLNVLDYLAVLVTFGAVVIEYISDEQMRNYKKRGNTGPEAIMDKGLWKYSRHPNYFGEVAFWVGLFLFAIAADFSYWWTGAGALAMILLFVFISIPMMDKKMLKKRPGFEKQMKSTSALLLLPRKRNEE
ncbi:MAG: DUF1295 domain-containing protein [Chitinophagales bacterium]|nr:DUF1295 domain-containing protein [Chitinophagales bacterium]